MQKVRFNNVSAEKILQYFENYIYLDYATDMVSRAYKISKIRSYLMQLDAHFDEVFVIEGKNYIDIENFCIIEFAIENNYSEILVKNIYFK